MPDTQSRPAASRKLGGIPHDETASPGIYRKPAAFKMRPIPRPVVRKKVQQQPKSSGGSSSGGWLLAILVFGGAGYLAYQKPPQLVALYQRLTAASARSPVVAGGVAPLDTTPLVDASQGWVWLFEEGEWRVPNDAQHESSGGLLRLRSSMEKPQPAADATIRARIVIRDGGGSAGVFLRSTPAGGRYRLAVDADQRFVRLVHQGPASTEELGKHRFFKTLVRGDRLLLELRATGDRLVGSVNGEQVIDVDDTRSKEAGSWGIESSDAWFELVEVPIAAPKTMAEATPPAPAEPAPMPAAPMPVAAPAPVPAAPPTDTGKWLASMEPQWQASFEREVGAPFQASVNGLKNQFLGTIETQLAAATQARKFEDAAFFRGERQRLAAGEDVPMTDESIVPPSLVNLRNGYRNEFAKFDKARADRAKAFHARIDSLLAQSQNALVQRQRAEEAVEIKTKREQLAALWVPLAVPPAGITAPPAGTVASAAATSGAPRPLIGTAPTVSAFAKMPPRQIVEKLLAVGAGVWITQKTNTPPDPRRAYNNGTEIKAMTELSGDKFAVTRVDFRRESQDEKPFSTADLAIVEALGDVTELSLRGPGVTDVIFDKLKTLRRLDSLTVEGAKITAVSYGVLPTLPDLRELRLNGSGASDDAMKSVGQCRRLERLSLTNTPITDAGLAPIGKLPALQELDLSNLDKLTSTGIGFLGECRTLDRLNLSGIRLSSNVLEAVARCAGLQSLTLSGNPLKDDQIAGLSALTKLHTLNLSNTGIVGTAFAKWPTRGAMTTLNLNNQPGVDDAALKAIGAAFPKLESLDISGVPLGATAAGFAAVGRLRNLKTLRVGGPVVNDEIMEEIAKCHDLQTLVIADGRLTDPGVVALAKLTRLSSLGLDLPPVTDAALKSFAKCKALKSIQIGEAAPEDVETKLRAALPGVSIRK